MSKRAEQAASAAYPENGSDNWIARPFFQEGYEQAEKELALTVEDIKTIIHLYGIVCEERTFDTLGEIYEEVLRRFNKAKEK